MKTPSLAARLVAELSGHQQIIATPRLFIRLTGDHASALVLAQLTFHHMKNGYEPFHLSDAQLEAEVYVTERQMRRIRATLEPLGVRTFRAGIPARMHYDIDLDRLSEALGELAGQVPTKSGNSGPDGSSPPPPQEEAEQVPTPGGDQFLPKVGTVPDLASGASPDVMSEHSSTRELLEEKQPQPQTTAAAAAAPKGKNEPRHLHREVNDAIVDFTEAAALTPNQKRVFIREVDADVETHGPEAVTAALRATVFASDGKNPRQVYRLKLERPRAEKDFFERARGEPTPEPPGSPLTWPDAELEALDLDPKRLERYDYRTREAIRDRAKELRRHRALGTPPPPGSAR